MDFSVQTLSGYNFCYRTGLPQIDLAHLISILIQPEPSQPSTLGGRASVRYFDFPALGKIVIKSYCRGGLLGSLVRRYYLRMGAVRSQREFEMLELVRSFGIKAPEPLLFVHRGGVFYRTWLITREVEDKESLVELARRDEELAREALGKLLEQVIGLIRHRVLHIDLHPGNVLVDKSGSIFLVDFDKAQHFNGSTEKLRDQYLFRWRRAVIKHALPEFLSELVSLGLRSVEARPA